MVIDNVVNSKVAQIKKCVARVVEEYAGDPSSLVNITKLDSITLNIQRACEASIDLAMYLVKQRSLGVPESSRDAFDLLFQAKVIDDLSCNRLKKMVGFRNIAIHQYQDLKKEIIQSIVESNLDDLLNFADTLTKATQQLSD